MPLRLRGKKRLFGVGSVIDSETSNSLCYRMLKVKHVFLRPNSGIKNKFEKQKVYRIVKLRK